LIHYKMGWHGFFSVAKVFLIITKIQCHGNIDKQNQKNGFHWKDKIT